MRSSDTPTLDRDYHYWIVTLDADPVSSVETAQFCRGIVDQLRRQIPSAEVVAVDLYRDIGSVDLQTDRNDVRTWSHCFIAELADPASAGALIQAAASPILNGVGWGEAICLTSELTVRKINSGTAVPALAATSREMPQNYSTAIEYIAIPEPRLIDYADFMRDVFGPVGRWLITHGYSERIIITEPAASFHRHPSMPFWNHVHILTGDFSDPDRGFHYGTVHAASAILGSSQSVASAMEPISSYRRKPKMSRNVLVASATFDPDDNDE